MVARALLRLKRGNAKPDTEVEARPLQDRSQDASPVDAEVEKPEGVSNQRYDLYRKV